MHHQIQQIQQRINTVSQMASQIRQSEENNRQKLMQLAQEEAFAAQQMNRIQQLCQESISSLHNVVSGANFQQQLHQGSVSPMHGQGFGQAIPTGVGSASPFSSNPTALFNLATMGPDTYEDTLQYMEGQSGSTASGGLGG